jgi:hypothetical protein
MKANFFLVFVTFLFWNSAQAQVTKESFDKAVDYLNCKTVELTLKDDKNLDYFNKECPCNGITYQKIKIFFDSARKLDNTINLSIEIESLKNTFKESWNKDESISFLTEKIFFDSNKYPKLFSFAKKRQGLNFFNDYKSILKSEIDKILVLNYNYGSIDTSSSIVEEPNTEKEFDNVDKNTNPTNYENWYDDDYFKVIFVSILISIIISLITFYFVFKMIKSNNIDLTTSIKDYLKKNVSNEYSNRNMTPNIVTHAEINELATKIKSLEVELKNLTHIVPASVVSINETTHSNFQESKQSVEKSDIFFLSSPNSDGSFDESSASSFYKEGASIYRFTKIGYNKSKFQISEKDASIKLALQYRDKRIDPVCEATNAFNQSSNIITESPGEAELQGNKWVVTLKSKIKYEN